MIVQINQTLAYIFDSLVSHHTPLHLAAQNRNAALVKLLFQYGAKSDVKNSKGMSCFDVAIGTGVKHIELNKEIIEQFLEHGHAIDERYGSDTTMTGLFSACEFNQTTI